MAFGFKENLSQSRDLTSTQSLSFKTGLFKLIEFSMIVIGSNDKNHFLY